MYESLENTPDELVLWFHHVNWTHKLHSGKTVIQHFYDAHYEGANTTQKFAKMLATLKGKIDGERFDEMMYRQTYQAGHSIIWRDSIVDFYWNMTGIEDEEPCSAEVHAPKSLQEGSVRKKVRLAWDQRRSQLSHASSLPSAEVYLPDKWCNLLSQHVLEPRACRGPPHRQDAA